MDATLSNKQTENLPELSRARRLFLRGPSICSLFTAMAAQAHPVNFNSTIDYASSQPSGGAASIANWTGAAFDAANLGGSGVNADGSPDNGSANDASTYVANNQPAQGQTFTTGSHADGYDFTAITVRMAGYTNNTASGGNVTSWNLNAFNGPIIVNVGRISGTTHTTVSMQNFTAGGTGHPGAGGSANGAGTYLTFQLPFPVHLDPNTTYSFDFTVGNGSANYFEWLGISGDPHAGGTAYTRNGGTITPLAGDRVFQADLTASAAPHIPFVHPGTLHTQADFDRMTAKVAANAQPWKTSYDALLASPFAQTWWPAYDIDYINRGGAAANNYTRSQQDAQAIYQLALRWKLTGDTACADKAVQIANVWSGLLGVTGDTNGSLASGICGYLFAIGGEILSTYPGWPAAEERAYKDMMMRVFYPANFDFLWRHHGTPESKGGNTHYRLNWDTCNMASMAAIGILCDNRAVYQQAVDYFKFGPGNGNAQRAAWYLHPDGTAQTEESGRDQPHNQGGWYAMGLLCQMAWNQGDDLFGYDNNRVLRAYEYNARYNLGHEVPWVFHRNASLTYTETLSGAGRGLGGYPSYELIHNHYANVKGIATPWSKQAMDVIRPEVVTGTGGHPSGQDCLGLGSLTFARDDTTTGSAPSGLTARWSKNQVVLTWWGTATATSYQIQRATNASGPYTTLGTAVEPDLNFTDTAVTNGTSYHYKVVAVTPSGNFESAPLPVSQAMVARYTFEGNTSDVAGTRHATAMGGMTAPGYAPGFGGGQAISLNGSGQYVKLPAGSGCYRDITISSWVYWNGGGNWQRVFDFGSEIEKYMMLTVKDGSGKLNFSITTSRNTDGTLSLVGPVMPTATWTHVAVTFNGNTATLYVNGVPVAAGAAPMVAPVFSQPFCYLGRSIWNGDAYFNGGIDDFRIHNHALSGSDVYSLWGQSSNNSPVFTSDPINLPTAAEDAAYTGQTLAGLATDANGGALAFSKVSGPAWLGVASNGTLSGTPSNSDVGANLFVVRVTDSSGATDDANLSINVSNTNDAPIWISDPLVKPSVTRDQPYLATSLAADAVDVDGGTTLTFSKVAGPAWLTVAADGTLSGTPGVGDVGPNNLTVRVTDNANFSADATLTIDVLPFGTRAHYLFEDNTEDSLGNFPSTATGSPAYATGRLARGIVLDGIDDFVTLPPAAVDSQDITVAAWVLWNGGAANQRVFDFGNNTSQYLFLSPNSGGLRFAIKNGGGEQQLTTATLATGQWVHLAVTLGGNTAKLYVNGVLAATNDTITIHPGDFKPAFNYIGKSQWADPLFNGMIDGFRVYNYAITPTEIAVLIDEVPAVPLGVTATPKTSTIELQWSASQGAQTYTVKRSQTSGGPYTMVASGLTGTTFSNTGLTNGIPYYYVISATNAKGESADSAQVTAVPSDLLAWWKFNETSGTVAADSSGNGKHGTLTNGPAWAPGLFGGGINIPAVNNESVTLPAGIVSGLGDFTISGWVKINAFTTFSRIFDFGTGTNNYMFLTPQYTTTAPNAAKLRFAMRTPSVSEDPAGAALNQVNSTIAMTAGDWTHIAVTLTGSTGRIYVNGTLAGTTTTMTLKPSDLGNTTLNWFGDSQFGADPTLNGRLDDFRIHSRALSDAEINAAAHPSPEAPAGLTVGAGDTRLPLSWKVANFTSTYTLKRATVSGGPYTAIASGLTATTFNDTGLTNGTTYYYVVSSSNTQGESADSAEVAATPTHLRLHLKLDESEGATVTDSSGLGWHGTTTNGPVWESGKISNALTFTGASSQYAALPTNVTGGLTDTTIMTWIKLTANPTTWQRIFDFGTGTTDYMFLSTQFGTGGDANKLRFAIRTPTVGEEIINSASTTPVGQWAHVAVVLSGSTGRLYLNGVQVGTNHAMTLTPSSLGSTTQNYLGKSQWNDPYLNAALDDFRIYSRAMTAEEIAAFATPLSAPLGLEATGGLQQIQLAWDPVPNATTYTVRSATNTGGPYDILASGLTTTGYVHTGLSSGETLFYIVRATNLTGDGPDSTEASASTDPAHTPSENWRFTNFGTTNNTGNAADTSDPDRDGLNNLLEYALGSNPNSNAASAAPEVSTATGKLKLAFTRNTDATDLILSVIAADSLTGPWSEIARSSNGAAFTAIAPGALVSEPGAGTVRNVETTDIILISDPAHPKRFMRLEVRR